MHEGYNQGQPDMVCLFRNSLYGLKQAPHAWFEKFRSTIINAEFSQSISSYSLFIQHCNTSMIVLLLYVNDMIITGNNENRIVQLNNLHNATFKMKDLGMLTYSLGLEVEYLQDGIMLSERKYGDDLVAQAFLSDQKVAQKPMEINVRHKNDDGGPHAEPTLYLRIIGCLNLFDNNKT